MKIVFRVSFRTIPGQSLWLRVAAAGPDGGFRLGQVIPMRWRNAGQWEAEIDIAAPAPLCLEYAYQLRQDGNGVSLDEWGDARTATLDPATRDTTLFHDTWRSAGTVDYAFETSAFDALLGTRPSPSPARQSRDQATHQFVLRMAALPPGRVPCLIGNTDRLGNWGWHHAIPLEPAGPHLWTASLRLDPDGWTEYKYGLYDTSLGCAVSLEEGENRLLEPHRLSSSQSTHIHDEAYRHPPGSLPRAAGVAIPVFSLRSHQSLGTGEFADLKPLADWAADAGLRLIQILPVNDTTSSHTWTDSYPYSAISVFALHPIYLRIESLDHPMPAAFHKELSQARERLNALPTLDYEEVMKTKRSLTRQIYQKHRSAILADAGFLAFLQENREWLVPYAVFCINRDRHGTADYHQWGEWSAFDRERADSLASPGHPEWPDLAYPIWLQYELDRQLTDAVRHLHTKGIALKGDLPIGIDRHSVDAWSLPHLFKLDQQAGAPPDAFAVKGQNWGFPTYHWEAMARDGYAWWRSRFAHLGRYFDAFRIDHILGFFRIWQVPTEQVEGIMGWFDPALPVHIDEIHRRGIPFHHERFCQPYIRHHFLHERFGESTGEVLESYLTDCGHGAYRLKDHVSTQRQIVEHFATWELNDPAAAARAGHLRQGLLDCASEVLFFEVPGSHGTLFHPRCSMHATRSFQDLDHDTKCRLDDLYIDYFYRRQEGYWQARGYEKLPAMRRASRMLLCGEDLGMVPDCVPGVLRELGILSLEIQRMPKNPQVRYADPGHAPYMSVVSPSTHDMPTLRGWWREDPLQTADFAWQTLGVTFPPLELTGELAARILDQHLHSPAMWAIFPLQDLLAIDEDLRHPDPDAERINIPAIMPFYWRYRTHLTLEALAAAGPFRDRLQSMIRQAGRTLPAPPVFS